MKMIISSSAKWLMAKSKIMASSNVISERKLIMAKAMLKTMKAKYQRNGVMAK